MTEVKVASDTKPRYQFENSLVNGGSKYVYLFSGEVHRNGVTYGFDTYVDNARPSGEMWHPKAYVSYATGGWKREYLKYINDSEVCTETVLRRVRDYVLENWWTVYERLTSKEALCVQ